MRPAFFKSYLQIEIEMAVKRLFNFGNECWTLKNNLLKANTYRNLKYDLAFFLRWVREFLNDENLGLDVLIDYLSFRLGMMRHEQRIAESRTDSEERLNPSVNNTMNTTNTISDKQNGYARASIDIPDSPSIKRRSKHVAKLNMGESKDDIHVCIMCMRAIMNNKVRYFYVDVF